jgi:hypothetical protein
VNCSSSYTFLALAEDGEVVPVEPERYAPPSGEASARLNRFYEGFAEILSDIEPDEVGLILPESDPRQRPSYASLEPRIAMETLVRLATVRAEPRIGMQVLPRRRVRSRLGLSQSGKLHLLATELLPEPVGRYWKDKRDLAALAALAAEKA